MKLIPWSLPTAVVLLFLAAGPALAQGGGYRPTYSNPYGTPTVSPYLNLLNRGNVNPAITYYGIIRPEVQTYNTLGRLQGDINANAGALSAEQGQAGALTTGHSVQFLSTTHYFMNLTGAGGQQRPGALSPSMATGAVGSAAAKPQTGAQQPKP